MRPLLGTPLALLVALAAPPTSLQAQAPPGNSIDFARSTTNFGQLTVSGKFTRANEKSEMTTIELVVFPASGARFTPSRAT